ncbi:MAG: cyclic nucleotide-binding domain-containing protein [Syntrophorhabdaceae bacterium]
MTISSRVYPPNTLILREGALGNAMFLIKTGQVEITKKDQELGISVTIAKLDAGNIFGEMALITGEPRSATVTSIVPTEVYVLKKRDFNALLLEHPDMSVLINTVVNQRLASIKGSFFEKK